MHPSQHRAIVCVLAWLLSAGLGAAALADLEPEQAAAVPSAALAAEEPSAPEMLLFQQIPVVVTASRMEQRVTEAPASVSVISRQEILNSGAVSLPDLLRMVPGVDVMQTTGAQWDVGIRGFSHIMSNKVLVLVDGRTVYSDYYANVNWHELPVVLEDIERIEVIRGPLSSLWGANAYLGVINIITRPPAAAAGTLASASWGTRGTLRTAAVHGGQSADGRLRYKLSAAREEVGQWTPFTPRATSPAIDNRDAGEVTKANATVQWDDARGANWTLSGGACDGGIVMLVDLTPYHRFWQEDVGYLSLAYERDNLSVRTYWNNSRLAYHAANWPLPIVVHTDLYDIEALKSRDFARHTLVYGASYRQKQVGQMGMPALDAPHHQNLWAAYVEDAYQASRRTDLVLSARYDHHPLAGGELSGRATIMHALSPRRTLRLSAATAFRSPNFLESYLYLPVVVLYGNTALDSEGITSYDLEYRAQLSPSTSASATLYYSDLEDLIHVLQTPGPPPRQEFNNLGGAHAAGVELEVRRQVSGRLTTFLNYTYQSLGADAVVDRDRPDLVGTSPRHKANWGINLADPGRGLNASLLVHYRDRIAVEGSSAGPYVLLNGYVGKRVAPNAEAGLSFFNLANRRHQQYPEGDVIGRRIMASLRCEF